MQGSGKGTPCVSGLFCALKQISSGVGGCILDEHEAFHIISTERKSFAIGGFLVDVLDVVESIFHGLQTGKQTSCRVFMMNGSHNLLLGVQVNIGIASMAMHLQEVMPGRDPILGGCTFLDKDSSSAHDGLQHGTEKPLQILHKL